METLVLTESRFLLLPKDVMRLILRDPRNYQQISSTCADFAKLHGSAAEWKQHYRYECSYESSDNTYTWAGPIKAANDIMSGKLNRILVKWNNRITVGATLRKDGDGFIVYYSKRAMGVYRNKILVFSESCAIYRNARLEIGGDHDFAIMKYIHLLGRIKSTYGREYYVEFIIKTESNTKLARFEVELVDVKTNKSRMVTQSYGFAILKRNMMKSMNVFLPNPDIKRLISKIPPPNCLTWYSRLRDFPAAMQIYDAWLAQ